MIETINPLPITPKFSHNKTMTYQIPVFVNGARGSAAFFFVFFNPIKLTDPDGKAILATLNAFNLFHNKNNGIKHISNTYNKPRFQFYSGISFINRYGQHNFLEDSDNNSQTKQEKNKEKLGSNISKFFIAVADKYTDAIKNGKDISFTSVLMDDKFDDDGNQYYELTMNVNGKRDSTLFYYTNIDGNTKDKVFKRVGDLFSSLKGGKTDDWKPSSATEISGETPFK